MDETEKILNIEKFLSENHMAENFLMSKHHTLPVRNDNSVLQKRLNDYDSSLFEETSVQKIEDPGLKLETKIEKTEEMISVLEEKLVVAESVQDTMLTKKIFIQKLMLEKELEKLQNEYKEKGFDAKIAQGLVNVFGVPGNIKKDLKTKVQNFVKNSGITKPFQPVKNFFKIKDTLSRLDKINKSVDELISMDIPFGEGEERYQALANHIVRANYLQKKIEKEFKK